MKYAYKVWHSETHKWTAKRHAGRILDDDEIRIAHESIKDFVTLNYQLEPEFTVSVVALQPTLKGVIVVLDSDLGEDHADGSIARCLVRINSLDAALCLIAEPLPVSAT